MKKLHSLLILFAVALVITGCKEDDDYPVPPASTVPKFSYTIDNDGFAPANVSFTNESIVPEVAGTATFTWNFGDGKSSTDDNPTHTFEEPGAYTVSLAVVTSASLEVKSATRVLVIKDPNETGTEMFFTDGTLVYTTLASDLNPDPIFTTLSGPSFQNSYGMTIDTVNNKLYMSDASGNAIYRSDMDGSNFAIFRSNLDTPTGLAIDYQEKQIYFDSTNGIQRADMTQDDPSQKETFASGIPNDPEGVAIHHGNRTIYWNTYDGGLWRKNLDGTGETELSSTVDGGSIIVVNDRLYYDDWQSSGDIHLKSSDLNGGDVMTLATNIPSLVYGLAYEPATNKIYWGNRNAGKIMRANLDGSETETWYDGPGPRGICFGKEI